MKKIIVISVLFILLCSNMCYSMVNRYPENSDSTSPNEFYIDYHKDKYDDIDYNKPYITNSSYGKFTFNSLNVYNHDTSYLIKFDKYSDANRYYFGIINIFWSSDLYDNYIYKISIKYNNQEYDYPNVITHYKSSLIIDQEANSQLYDLLYNLLVQGIPFKMRIDENSKYIDNPASHVIEVTSTNFAESCIYAFSN